ncbi:unnamed protein product [Closterium sp. NIES-53]
MCRRLSQTHPHPIPLPPSPLPLPTHLLCHPETITSTIPFMVAVTAASASRTASYQQHPRLGWPTNYSKPHGTPPPISPPPPFHLPDPSLYLPLPSPPSPPSPPLPTTPATPERPREQRCGHLEGRMSIMPPMGGRMPCTSKNCPGSGSTAPRPAPPGMPNGIPGIPPMPGIPGRPMGGMPGRSSCWGNPPGAAPPPAAAAAAAAPMGRPEPMGTEPRWSRMRWSMRDCVCSSSYCW